jgi:hypothetical protein
VTHKFKVGDRVNLLPASEDDEYVGPGTVISVGRDGELAVEHDTEGLCWPLDQDVEPLCETPGKIMIDEAAKRKAQPVTSGVLDYFPDAIRAVAECSHAGNEQHNKGQQLHWARAKSGDEADALVRHLMERGTVDTDGIRHSAKVAWRALALLQKELEAAGAPMARGAKR